jgi:hypothetical protein
VLVEGPEISIRPVVLVAWWQVVLDEPHYDHHRMDTVASYGAGLSKSRATIRTRSAAVSLAPGE